MSVTRVWLTERSHQELHAELQTLLQQRRAVAVVDGREHDSPGGYGDTYLRAAAAAADRRRPPPHLCSLDGARMGSRRRARAIRERRPCSSHSPARGESEIWARRASHKMEAVFAR